MYLMLSVGDKAEGYSRMKKTINLFIETQIKTS